MAAGAADEEEDRLSGLPDDVLHSILARLPFKHAVRTSALSRRWPRLWLHALAASPVLDFTDPDFVRGHSRAQFVATVNRCLSARGAAPLRALRVAFSPFGAFERDVVGWISAALGSGATEVDVDLRAQGRRRRRSGGIEADAEDDGGGKFRRTEVELRGDLFCSPSSLSRLSLSRFSLRHVPPGAAGLAGLTSLSLSHVDVTDDALRDAVSGCPVLEFLSLRSCDLLSNVRIAGGRLRGLEVVRCQVRQLQVAAPALESFAFHGDLMYLREDDSKPLEFIGSKGNNVTPPPSEATPELRDAYLSHVDFSGEDEVFDGFAYTEFLNKVAHAKILTICSVALLHIEEERFFSMPTIDTPNLQELQVLMGSLGDDDDTRFPDFFELAAPPLLERLFIQLPADCDGDSEEEDTDMVPGHEISLGRLTFIKVANFRGTRRELRLLRFLVGMAPALEQLVLVTPDPEAEQGGTTLRHDDQDKQQLLQIVQEQLSEVRKARRDQAHVVVCRARDDGSRRPAHSKYYHHDRE